MRSIRLGRFGGLLGAALLTAGCASVVIPYPVEVDAGIAAAWDWSTFEPDRRGQMVLAGESTHEPIAFLYAPRPTARGRGHGVEGVFSRDTIEWRADLGNGVDGTSYRAVATRRTTVVLDAFGRESPLQIRLYREGAEAGSLTLREVHSGTLPVERELRARLHGRPYRLTVSRFAARGSREEVDGRRRWVTYAEGALLRVADEADEVVVLAREGRPPTGRRSVAYLPGVRIYEIYTPRGLDLEVLGDALTLLLAARLGEELLDAD